MKYYYYCIIAVHVIAVYDIFFWIEHKKLLIFTPLLLTAALINAFAPYGRMINVTGSLDFLEPRYSCGVASQVHDMES